MPMHCMLAPSRPSPPSSTPHPVARRRGPRHHLSHFVLPSSCAVLIMQERAGQGDACDARVRGGMSERGRYGERRTRLAADTGGDKLPGGVSGCIPRRRVLSGVAPSQLWQGSGSVDRERTSIRGRHLTRSASPPSTPPLGFLHPCLQTL
ncbi:hypothetical protein C8R45DRAFT_1029077 [Mycena sanguinolenta]|nr:hypothetical protein C8R45DRAFT_1029077 [Mycena sanguinolenta]